MKCLIVCGLVLIFQVIVSLAKEGDTFCEEELKCIEKLHLNKQHIESIINDDTTKFLPENDVDYNSFQFCHWNERELQDINGNFNYEKIVECIQEFPRSEFGGRKDDNAEIGSKIATLATASCMNIEKGESHGQTAIKIQNCIDKHMMELIEKEV